MSAADAGGPRYLTVDQLRAQCVRMDEVIQTVQAVRGAKYAEDLRLFIGLSTAVTSTANAISGGRQEAAALFVSFALARVEQLGASLGLDAKDVSAILSAGGADLDAILGPAR